MGGPPIPTSHKQTLKPLSADREARWDGVMVLRYHMGQGHLALTPSARRVVRSLLTSGSFF